MKNLIALLFILLSVLSASGQQNLVPNPSFEDTLGCPNNVAQIAGKCANWKAYTLATPDYHHVCASGNIGVPNNFAGFQYPKHGNAYCGLLAYYNSYIHFEYLTAQIPRLNIGWQYEVSMWVSLANGSKNATDNIGVYFFDSGLQTIATTDILPFQPQIYYSNYGIISDTGNWIKLTKTFTADSSYDNMVIGPYKNSSNTFNNIVLSNGTGGAYYYIDSVQIKSIDTFRIIDIDTMLCAKDSIDITVQVKKQFHTSNVFTIQLSDKNGSFASPTNIGTLNTNTTSIIPCVIPSNISNGGSYKIRIVGSVPADTSVEYWKSITITNLDSISFNVNSSSSVCESTAITFSASSNFSPTTYLWTGPNGFNSTTATTSIGGANTIHNGNYFVKLTFYGCELKDTLAVVVKPLPVKPVANSNTPLCAGETLNLTAASSTSGVTYSWTGPNSFATTTQNPTITSTTTSMSGDYIVAAILNGCQLTDTATVMVKPMPAVVTAGSNSPVCAGSSLQLTVSSSTTGSTYAWTGPNSFTANTQNTSVSNSTTAATGLYVTTVDLNGCKIKDSVNATVNAIPATPIASYSNPLCIGQTLNLAATTVAGATYSWTGIGGYTANTQNPTRNNMQFGNTGLYNVTSTMNGCTSPAGSVRVIINALPFVVIFPTPGDTICVGDNASFTALPNNHGGVPQYQWYINNTPVSGNGTTFSSTQLAHGDVVRCNMTENTKCNGAYTDESNDVNMKVLPWLAPSVTFTVNPNRALEVDEFVTFTATPANAGASPTYQWKRNGQNVQGATGSVWSANTLNDNDSISVEIISSYKCPQPLKGSANGVRVKILSGVGDVNNIKGLTVYPNPNNGRFVISGNLATNDEIIISLYNTIGQNIYTKTFTPTNKTLNHEVSIPEIASGIYLLKISQSGQTAVSRFRVN